MSFDDFLSDLKRVSNMNSNESEFVIHVNLNKNEIGNESTSE